MIKEIKKDDAAEVVAEAQLAQDVTKNTMILETEKYDILLEKYKKDLENKFSNRKLLISERYNIINYELNEKALKVKMEVKLQRKLKNERLQLERDWGKLDKYKNSKLALEKDIDRIMNKREKKLNDYVKTGIDPDEHDNVSLAMAEKIWIEINTEASKNLDKWNDMTLKQKLDPYIEKYKDFSNSYPIILKYMILQFQYNSNAFKRFLEKCRNNVPLPGSKHKEIEDVKFQNQAYYIQYLYEEYQKGKGHIDRRKANEIFTEAYIKLRKEKKDFETSYEEIKEKIDNENKNNAKSLLTKLTSLIEKDFAKNDSELRDDSYKLLKTFSRFKKQ